MAEEEFQESEVIFSDDNNDDQSETDFDFQEIYRMSSKHGRFCKSTNKMAKKKKINVSSSVPVNIPDSVFRFQDKADLGRNIWDEDDDDEGSGGGDGELVPPHVIVGRRISCGKMAYSVCTGNGRTLKGRDLSQVRNSILRLTGFLET